MKKQMFIILLLSINTINIFTKPDALNIKISKYQKQFQSKNPAMRILAIKKISKINHKKTLPLLHKSLKDPINYIKILSIKRLSQLKYQDSVEKLIVSLKKEKNIFIKKLLIESLGNFKNQKARETLKKLTKNKNLIIKTFAKKSLKKLDTKESSY